MTCSHLKQLTQKFRLAIESALHENAFFDDYCFKNFPKGCCGDASCLLAEYLLQKGIETIWVSAQRDDWTHAWLLLKDSIDIIHKEKNPLRDDYIALVSRYKSNESEDKTDILRYEEKDLYDGLIIDITSDQFDDYDVPVYVGYMDEFHQSFDFIQAWDYYELCGTRLKKIYRIIEGYIG